MEMEDRLVAKAGVPDSNNAAMTGKIDAIGGVMHSLVPLGSEDIAKHHPLPPQIWQSFKNGIIAYNLSSIVFIGTIAQALVHLRVHLAGVWICICPWQLLLAGWELAGGFVCSQRRPLFAPSSQQRRQEGQADGCGETSI
jgi:hypothetical protein